MSEAILKQSVNGLDIEYELTTTDSVKNVQDERSAKIRQGLSVVDQDLDIVRNKINKLDTEIERLTNHADGLDYAVAVISGILTGLIDSLWVGEFSMNRGKAWSNHAVNDLVMTTAKGMGYKGERLDGAIKFIENKAPIPSDNLWYGKDIGISSKSHHLDDLAHHPTLVGLIFSILTQFTREGYFSNREGSFFSITVEKDQLIGGTIPEKIFCGAINWFLHLVGDMSGSNKTAGVGMGIPGPIVAILKELSALPGINRTELAMKLKDVFTKEKFDLRGELAVGHELARQAVPVVINEVLVRTFYFIRHFCVEYKKCHKFSAIEWKKTLPFNNRTIVRMLTIAHGTFVAVDSADAAIRAFIKSGPELAAFLANFVLRVNFVGVGRFTIACYSDLKMGSERRVLYAERVQLYSKIIFLTESKVFYKQAEAWIAAEDAEKMIVLLEKAAETHVRFFADSLWEIHKDLPHIGRLAGQAECHNPGLKKKLLKLFN